MSQDGIDDFVGVDLAPELAGEAGDISQAQAILVNAATQAATTIVEIASGDTEDPRPRTQFEAAKYVLDRVLGTPARSDGAGADPWDALLRRLDGGKLEDKP